MFNILSSVSNNKIITYVIFIITIVIVFYCFYQIVPLFLITTIHSFLIKLYLATIVVGLLVIGYCINSILLNSE